MAQRVTRSPAELSQFSYASLLRKTRVLECLKHYRPYGFVQKTRKATVILELCQQLLRRSAAGLLRPATASAFLIAAVFAVNAAKAQSASPNADELVRQGHAAHDRGNDAEAVALFRKAADQGSADGEFNLGVVYQNGFGLPRDLAQAIAWYRKAADHGSARAQFNLGLMHDQGIGVTKDLPQAIVLYRKAAALGLAEAQVNLGAKYAKGEGVEQNDREAFTLFKNAAAQDVPDAQNWPRRHVRERSRRRARSCARSNLVPPGCGQGPRLRSSQSWQNVPRWQRRPEERRTGCRSVSKICRTGKCRWAIPARRHVFDGPCRESRRPRGHGLAAEVRRTRKVGCRTSDRGYL